MQILERTDRQGSRPTFHNTLSGLARHLGSDRFDDVLSQSIETAFGCNQITVFSFAGNLPPRVVNLVAHDNQNAVREAANQYMNKYWKVDPSNLFISNHELPGTFAVLMSQADVEDRDFRRDCYFRTGIGDRLSLVTQTDTGKLKVSIHRSIENGTFSDEHVDDLLETGEILTSLLLRHHELCSVRQNESDPEHFERLMAIRWPSLTHRERQVCSMIAIGMSSEAIALTLDVSINTVLTFRRRAYARLNISTQNELLRILFQAQLN